MVLSLALRMCRRNLSRVPLVGIQSYGKQIVRESHRKSVYKTDEAKKIRFYILSRFMEYLKNYDKILEKSFPTTMQTYRVFTDGLKNFTVDTKEYFKILIVLNNNQWDFSKLLRRELELYHQMPKDLMKISPILIFSGLPFAFYVILPLIYALPKAVLTSHFWSPAQKTQYELEYMHDRLLHNRPVFRHLQSQMNFIKHKKDLALFQKWDQVLGFLGSGVQPKVEDILACKELFQDEPYHLLYLSRNHIFHLLKIHNIHTGWFRRTRLADRAMILIEMDKAIMKEGGVHNMSLNALSKACALRGLNPTNLNHDYMVRWLTQWIKVSRQIDKDSYSLLLHCPILLAYNEPSNWSLIYSKK